MASDDASYINGTDFLVDGGLSACYVVGVCVWARCGCQIDVSAAPLADPRGRASPARSVQHERRQVRPCRTSALH